MKNLDVGMPMYNSLKYSENYPKTSGSSYLYGRDETDTTITNSRSLRLRNEITGSTPASNNVQIVTIAGPMKYLSTFYRKMELPLIIWKAIQLLLWSQSCTIVNNPATRNDLLIIAD